MNAIVIDGNTIKISVSVFLFKEGETYIAYCPSLDLSGYDTTEEKAKSDFEYMLKDWLKTQSDNKSLEQDLKIHGWNPEFIIKNNLRSLGLTRKDFIEWMKRR